jgi:hypothetical protein
MRRRLRIALAVIALALLLSVPASEAGMMLSGLGNDQGGGGTNFLLVNTGVRLLVNTGVRLKVQ